MNELEALIKAVKEQQFLCNVEDCGSCRHMREVLSAAEAAVKTGGWHKWPEEKPETDGWYLVVLPSGTYWQEKSVFSALYKYGVWRCTLDIRPETPPDEITHWQPFPPLPESEAT